MTTYRDMAGVIHCPKCGANVIAEEEMKHRCNKTMIDGNVLWLRSRDGRWKRFSIPERVMARVLARCEAEGARLPPRLNTHFKHPENQQC